jgi:hypothetical protein
MKKFNIRLLADQAHTTTTAVAGDEKNDNISSTTTTSTIVSTMSSSTTTTKASGTPIATVSPVVASLSNVDTHQFSTPSPPPISPISVIPTGDLVPPAPSSSTPGGTKRPPLLFAAARTPIAFLTTPLAIVSPSQASLSSNQTTETTTTTRMSATRTTTSVNGETTTTSIASMVAHSPSVDQTRTASPPLTEPATKRRPSCIIC